MAYFYCDTDAGSDANSGVDWANANLTLEGLLSDMSAGDVGFFQGAAADTTAGTRTFTSPGTITNPCLIIGVVDGTTNEGTSVVAADLAVTLPAITCTGVDSDIAFVGFVQYVNIDFSISDRPSITAVSSVKFVNCKFAFTDRFTVNPATKLVFENCVYEPLATTANMLLSAASQVEWNGGSLLQTAATSIFRTGSDGVAVLKAFDLSGIGATALINSNLCSGQFKIINCSLPTTLTILGSAPIEENFYAEVVGSSDASSVAGTDSIQDYQYEDPYGTIDLETTAVRTGGADDDATGAFSYAMTPRASATLESSGATLKSPWMSVWVDGGSNTLTVYIANDSASTDYFQDECWVEFYTPDAGDTAQYDQTFDAGDARLLDSTTAITDDTGSTWGTGANNHQTFSATVTTGYTGWAYARLHLAKRSATPDTLFLDPRIIVS